MPEKKGNNRPVFVDFAAVNKQQEEILGRPLTESERQIQNEVDAIRIDARACGRTVATTVKNIEKFGPPVSDAVKAALGLIPPIN
jgi:hypothetical protein